MIDVRGRIDYIPYLKIIHFNLSNLVFFKHIYNDKDMNHFS